MKKTIGIAGGVGAGKSTVLTVLKEQYNAKIILTDEVGHELMMPGTAVYKKIISVFGEDILDEEGFFDKKKLSDLLFDDKEARAKMNSIVHPAVFEEVKKRAEQSKKDLVVIESALLIEAGFKPICDEVWYVYVPTQERVKRLYEQRGYSEVKSYSIIHSQMGHTELLKACDRILDNSSSREYTRYQVAQIMEDFPV